MILIYHLPLQIEFITSTTQMHIIMELLFLELLMLITQVHLRSTLFATISIPEIKSLGFNQLSVTAVIVYQYYLLTFTTLTLILIEILKRELIEMMIYLYEKNHNYYYQ